MLVLCHPCRCIARSATPDVSIHALVDIVANVHKKLLRERIIEYSRRVDTGEREEMTAAAIARLAGVGRAAVSNWRRRYPEFPRPVGGSSTSPTFDRAEVEKWLKASGKADQLATAGQTDTGTQRISEPERSITDLEPGDLLARSMAALLPRETAAGRPTEDQDEAEP